MKRVLTGGLSPRCGIFNDCYLLTPSAERNGFNGEAGGREAPAGRYGFSDGDNRSESEFTVSHGKRNSQPDSKL